LPKQFQKEIRILVFIEELKDNRNLPRDGMNIQDYGNFVNESRKETIQVFKIEARRC